MKKRFLLLPVISVFLVQFPLWADVQWLQYRTSDHAREIVGGRSQYIRPIEKAPTDIQLPKLETDAPKFIKWQTSMDSNGFRWGVLDKTHKYGLYDVLYMDSDGDGNLDDEQKRQGRQTDQYQVLFSQIPLYFEGDDGPITYHLNVQFYSYNERSTYIRAYSACWYEGTVRIGDTETRCAVIDYNCNGTFDDKSDNFNNDRIRTGPKETPHESYVGNFVELDGKLYRLAIAKDGAFIEFRAAPEVPYVEVTMPKAITSFSAGGLNGMFKRTVDDGRVKLPEGKYRIYSWAINRADDNGVKWTLRAYGGDEVKRDFTVQTDKEVSLDIGEPVFSNLSAPMRNKMYFFNQELKGRLGESISLAKDGNPRPPAPRIHVVNKTGEYDRTFALEYG